MRAALLCGLAVLAGLVFGPAVAQAQAWELCIREEFDGSMDSGWQWMEGGDPDIYSLEEREGFLQIAVQPNIPGLISGALLRPAQDEDFVLETKVLFEPRANFEKASIVVWGDLDNHMLLSRAFCSFVQWGCVHNGIYFDRMGSPENFALETAEQDVAWLRVTKTGRQVLGEYSGDGVTWQRIGTHELDFSGTLRIGVAATGSQDPLSSPPAYFDYVRIEYP